MQRNPMALAEEVLIEKCTLESYLAPLMPKQTIIPGVIVGTAWLDPKGDRGFGPPPWKITNCYLFPQKYFGPIVLEGGLYGPL